MVAQNIDELVQGMDSLTMGRAFFKQVSLRMSIELEQTHSPNV